MVLKDERFLIYLKEKIVTRHQNVRSTNVSESAVAMKILTFGQFLCNLLQLSYNLNTRLL